MQIHYHLGAFDDAVTFALDAGDTFNVYERTEYVATIIGLPRSNIDHIASISCYLGKCIDRYTALRVEQFALSEVFNVDARLESIVDRMFQRCFDTKELTQVTLLHLVHSNESLNTRLRVWPWRLVALTFWSAVSAKR